MSKKDNIDNNLRIQMFRSHTKLLKKLSNQEKTCDSRNPPLPVHPAWRKREEHTDERYKQFYNDFAKILQDQGLFSNPDYVRNGKIVCSFRRKDKEKGLVPDNIIPKIIREENGNDDSRKNKHRLELAQSQRTNKQMCTIDTKELLQNNNINDDIKHSTRDDAINLMHNDFRLGNEHLIPLMYTLGLLENTKLVSHHVNSFNPSKVISIEKPNHPDSDYAMDQIHHNQFEEMFKDILKLASECGVLDNEDDDDE